MREAIDVPAITAIDLGAFLRGSAVEQAAIAASVDDICRCTGFLIIENHEVSGEIIENAWTHSRAFFDLPLEEKLTAKSADPKCPRGYFPMASETLAKSLGVDTPPDVKESFGIGRLNAPPIELSTAEKRILLRRQPLAHITPRSRQYADDVFQCHDGIGRKSIELVRGGARNAT